MTESGSISRAVPYEEASAEDIAEANAVLAGFTEDMAQRRLKVDTNPFEAVRWATAVLWLASDDGCDGVESPLLQALDDDRGVSATKVAQLLPAFVDRMNARIRARAVVDAIVKVAPAATARQEPSAGPQPDDVF